MSELLEHIKKYKVTQGEGAGELINIFPWEEKFILGLEKNKGSNAALSMARGNGKTSLIGTISAACIDGPLRMPRAETIVVAPSLNQARITFEHACAFLGIGRP